MTAQHHVSLVGGSTCEDRLHCIVGQWTRVLYYPASRIQHLNNTQGRHAKRKNLVPSTNARCALFAPPTIKGTILKEDSLPTAPTTQDATTT